MAKKLLVTLSAPGDATAVANAGCEIVAEYPHSLLVRATDAQRQALEQQHLEITDVAAPPIQLGGASFDFSSAVDANVRAPVPAPDPNRTAYYLAQLVG